MSMLLRAIAVMSLIRQTSQSSETDIVNFCLSAANVPLYAVSEAAILIAGYSPAIGFIHTGAARSFVFDVADMFKFDVMAPMAFRVAADLIAAGMQDRAATMVRVRTEARAVMRKAGLLGRLIPAIEDVLGSGAVACS